MKSIFYSFILILSVVSLFVLINMMLNRYENKKINQVYIEKIKENSLLSKKDIKNLILKAQKNIYFKNEKISKVSVSKLQGELQNHPFIKKAEVFFSPSGSLHIHIWLHKPIARIKSSIGEEYYLTSESQTIGLSKDNTAEVPLVKGDFSKTEHTFLKTFIEHINQIPLLKKQLIGIKKIDSEEFKFAIRLKNHLVIFGVLDNFKEKIIKLEEFYKQYLSKIDIRSYKAIDLQYKDQVIAIKRLET